MRGTETEKEGREAVALIERVHGEKEEDVKTRSGTNRRKTQTDKS